MRKVVFHLIAIIFIGLMMTGCRGAKGLDSDAKINPRMTAKQAIRENQRQVANFKTLQAKLKVDYTNNGKTQGYTVNLRMEKDKTIWLNATLGLARVMLTPESAKFYDKINNRYYDGDYKLISDFLGTKLDYEKIQNMLLGEPIYDLTAEKHIISDDGTSYILQPEDQKALFELFYLLNPSHFKLDSQQLAQLEKKRMLQIDYADYQEVNSQIVPLNLRIIAVEDTEEVSIALEYKSVEINEEVRFPFNFPSGFEEIQLDDLPH